MSPRHQEMGEAQIEGEPERPPTITRKKREVSFGSVRTRQYQRILTDHPGCSSGPPIGIGWAHRSTEEIELDDCEGERTWDSSPAVPLSTDESKNILKTWKYSSGEILRSQRQVSRVQSQRKQSNAPLIRRQRFKKRATEFGSSIRAAVKRLNPLHRSPAAPEATTFVIDGQKYKVSTS